jgi:hypothetical protein
MSRRMYGRAITAAAFAAALVLASPVHAVGWSGQVDPSGLFRHAWQWLVGTWPGARDPGRPVTKEGAGVDPQGAPRQLEGSRSITKEGAGVDPDGRQVPGTAPGVSSTMPSDPRLTGIVLRRH